MNKFDKTFFAKYLPEGVEIEEVVHIHITSILGRILVMLGLFVIIPSFLYYESYRIKDTIPFFLFEIFLFLMFAKIIYDIFDWYNDCWIITNEGIYDIKRKLWGSNIMSIKYEMVEGVEIEQDGIWDIMLKKGSLILQRIGDDEVHMNNASNPFNAANVIENLGGEEAIDEKKDRFEMILDALSGVVESHLKQKREVSEEDTDNKQEETIANLKQKEGTIDLR